MADQRLVVATPWYPTEANPYAGTFVASWLRALDHAPERTLIIHLDNVLDGDLTPRRTTSELGDVLRIPVGVTSTMPRPEMARRQLAALRDALPPELAAADVVHAHVGMPTAWAVSEVVPRGVRLVVTEHASYLSKVLRDPEGRAMYGALVSRASQVLTVSESAARQLRTTYPASRERVTSTGNPVATDLFPLRRLVPGVRRHWVYIGNLIPAKGVDRVIRSFAGWTQALGGETSLTLVGQGHQEAELRTLAERLGIADVVDFAGPLPHTELHRVLDRADLLVHLAHFETFGLTAIEAVVSGLPAVVTACGGPEETLADAAADGLVQYVPVGDDVEPVLAAVRRLQGALPMVNPAAVRADLDARFGYRAFGARLRQVVLGEGVAAARPDAPVVVALALTPRANRRVSAMLQAAIRAGARTVLVTNEHEELVATDPRTRTVSLAEVGRLDPVRLAELVLLHWPTRAPLALAQAALGGLSGRQGAVGAAARSWRPGLDRVERLRARVCRAVRARLLYPAYYSWIDPLRLGLAGVHRHGDDIARDGVDVIVYGDDDGLPLAWRLARRHPDAAVVGAISGAALGRLVAQRADRADARDAPA